jgi:hypothetical protein
MAMTDEQFYGGSKQEADDDKASFDAREKAIRNGYTVRREKRGKQTVIVITPNEDPKEEQVS